jgi:NAD(P)-dependent dehydrogenase (short-subunit alcohol dehydrogenase family)
MGNVSAHCPSATRLHKALIVGASRGLGLAIAEAYLARGTHVVGTVRPGPQTKLHTLRESWPDQLEIEAVDVTVVDQVAALRSRLDGKTFDLLLINAGITNEDRETIADVTTDEFVRVMVTNALSPLRAIETMHDLVDPNGTIAVMSSGQGSVANNERGGHDVYRASKAALNTLMRSYAARHASDRRTLLLLAPGWIRTDLGGSSAPSSIEESVPVLVATIEAQRGKGGLQYIDREGHTVPW